MFFKTAKIAGEWVSLHPDTRAALCGLDDWMFENGLERMTITDALRTPDNQEALYTKYYVDKGFKTPEARRLARKKFSWHLVGSAADFRHSIKPYSKADMEKITARLKVVCQPSRDWELLLHSVGHGLHFHVARREEYHHAPPKGTT
jgi:hypothetical protein